MPNKNPKYWSREFVVSPKGAFMIFAHDLTQTPWANPRAVWRKFKVEELAPEPAERTIRDYIEQILTPKIGADASKAIAGALTEDQINAIQAWIKKPQPKRKR